MKGEFTRVASLNAVKYLHLLPLLASLKNIQDGDFEAADTILGPFISPALTFLLNEDSDK